MPLTDITQEELDKISKQLLQPTDSMTYEEKVEYYEQLKTSHSILLGICDNLKAIIDHEK